MMRGRKPLLEREPDVAGYGATVAPENEANAVRQQLGANGGPPLEPDMPDWLDDEAQAEWHRVVAEMADLGWLARADRVQLTNHCVAWSRAREAERQLTESATLLVKTATGYVMPNPLIYVAQGYWKHLLSIDAEFGMTPASRARIRKALRDSNRDQGDLFDDFGDYLAGGKGQPIGNA